MTTLSTILNFSFCVLFDDLAQALVQNWVPSSVIFWERERPDGHGRCHLPPSELFLENKTLIFEIRNNLWQETHAFQSICPATGCDASHRLRARFRILDCFSCVFIARFGWIVYFEIYIFEIGRAIFATMSARAGFSSSRERFPSLFPPLPISVKKVQIWN